jgi:hypothetical protein
VASFVVLLHWGGINLVSGNECLVRNKDMRLDVGQDKLHVLNVDQFEIKKGTLGRKIGGWDGAALIAIAINEINEIEINEIDRGGPTQTKTKKTVEDYVFYVGSSKQASDYEITAEFVVNHIKKTSDRGNDIAEAIRTLVKTDTLLWKPSLQVSTGTQPTVKAREDKQYVMEYKAELDESMRHKRTYQDNIFKAYALLWERCAKAMQNKIASRSDYESVVHNDPISLLRAIKEHSLNY